MPTIKPITPCLWFDSNAEDAAKFYVSVFPDSKITATWYYPDEGREIHGKPPGSVLLVKFNVNGQPFAALNAGPTFKFTEAVSFQIFCDTQQEIDRYWEKLGAGGDPRAQQCGWLKDRFGLSWQVVPSIMETLFSDPDREKAQRAFGAMMKMKKMKIAELERAFEGKP